MNEIHSFLTSVTLLTLLISVSGCATTKDNTHSDLQELKNQMSRLESRLIESQASRGSIDSLSKSIVELAETRKRSVVAISANPDIITNNGAGFIYNQDGIILTNDHIVRVDVLELNGEHKTYYPETVHVKLYDGRTTSGRLIGIDPSTDLAAVKIDIDNLPAPLVFADRKVQQGELAFTIGHPRGLDYSLEWRPIGAVYRKGSLPGTLVHQMGRGFFVGNSGGPVFDLEGKVIGMVYASINFRDRTNPETTVLYPVIGWAVTAETLQTVAPQMLNGKHKITGFIGGE